MNNVPVEKATPAAKAALPVFAEIHKRFEEVRRRAEDLFLRRGGEAGRDLEDWFQAEREVFGDIKAELTEKDNAYEIQVALPGFDAKDVHVTTTPEEVVIRAATEHRKEEKEGEGRVLWSEFDSREVYRCFALPKPADTEKVAAKLDKGILRITAPCAAQAKPATPESRQVKIVAA